MPRLLGSFSVVLACSLTLFGCSSSSDKDNGTAPVAKNFTLTPGTIDLNKPTILDCKVTIEDPDGDFASVFNQVTLPDGTPQPATSNSITQLGNATAQELPFKLQVPGLPFPGEYTISIWVKDKAGNESPKVSAKVTAK